MCYPSEAFSPILKAIADRYLDSILITVAKDRNPYANNPVYMLTHEMETPKRFADTSTVFLLGAEPLKTEFLDAQWPDPKAGRYLIVVHIPDSLASSGGVNDTEAKAEFRFRRLSEL